MSDPALITNRQLCELTGWTDARHKQMADDGWFPKSVKGQWELVPTVQGLLKYYRSKMEEGPKAEQMRLRNELYQLKIDLQKRSVIPLDEIRKTFTRYVVSAKSKTWAAIRTASQESGLSLGLNSDQMLIIEEKVSARVRQAFEELARCEWGAMECPKCKEEIKP